MSSIVANGVELSYEIIGDGPPMVWTNGGFLPRGSICYFTAGRFYSSHRVLIWDRRNCGESDVALDEEAPSEFHSYAEDLHFLLHELKMAPAIVGGGSGGYITSLLLAHLHPEDVIGLIACAPPTTQDTRINDIRRDHYDFYADLSEAQGMEAVADTPGLFFYWPQLCKRNPENRARLLSMQPKRFVALMRKWAAWGPYWRAGLTDEDLANVRVPTIVTPGFDKPDGLHPWQSGVELQKKLPSAEFLDWRALVGEEKSHALYDGNITELEIYPPIYDRWEQFMRTFGSN